MARLTPRQLPDRQLGGDQLAAQIVDLARVLHWRAVHHRPGRTASGYRTAITGDVGFPDVVVARAGALYVWECKRQLETVPGAQMAWIAALQLAGVDARVVRPSDWPTIEAVLRMPAGRRLAWPDPDEETTT